MLCTFCTPGLPQIHENENYIVLIEDYNLQRILNLVTNQRVVQSRIKIQEKIQDIQELQEKRQDKYKKIFSKEKIE